MQQTTVSAESVLDYWFGSGPAVADEAAMKRWFAPDLEMDREIERRFAGTVAAAGRGELDAWRATARGTLALIISLDQFPRNLFRRSEAAFQYDPQALAACIEGIDAGLDRELALLERVFFLMPLQHAESLVVQQRSVAAFDDLVSSAPDKELRRMLAGFADYAHQHHDIIRRFGRFPHRNRVLGRADTEAERAFLAEGGARFGQ
jgi:uncharacterized protein (DUF924 family)